MMQMTIMIRAFKMSDLDDVVELRSRPKAARGTLQLPYLSHDAVRKRYESPSPYLHSLVAEVMESGKVVGSLGLRQHSEPRRAHSGFIGMSVHDDYQNQGVGTQLLRAAIDLADNWLNISRLELTVFVDNAPAIHLYEKHGFVKEGTLRCYAYRDGIYVDAFTMARIREMSV
jgi:putative acetyltransferase